MAMVLSRYANEPINLGRVLKMLVVHDLGEIESDDVFLYDAARSEAQGNEQKAVEDLVACLPSKTRQEFMELWIEFAEGTSPEARFARSMDRFEPLLSNISNDGGSWLRSHITKDKAIAKNKHIGEGSTVLWDAYQNLAQQADERGLFHPKDSAAKQI